MDSAMLKEDYDRLVTEYFDITDRETRKILLSIDEADQNQVMSSLASKLYDSIVGKVTDIDFGTISKSAGDISKIENFDKMSECLATMRALVEAANQPSKELDTIVTAVTNIASRKELFEKAFKYNIELPMVVYNTLTLACVASTSFLISCCVEFIKSPADDSFGISIDKVASFKTSDALMFKNLERFNKSCASGEFDRCMNSIISTKVKNLVGVGVAVGIVAGVAIIALITQIVPTLREFIFLFYLTRVRISDYFTVQADLLDMNAANVEANTTLDPKKRKEIIKKQASIAEHFRKIANFVEVKTKDANANAIKQLEDSNKKLKIKDVVDKMPDSAKMDSLF